MPARSSSVAAATSSSTTGRPTSRRACSSTATPSATSPPATASRCGSASSGACSGRSRSGRSSAATATLSARSETDDGTGGSPPYHGRVLRRLRIENLVLIRAADLELDPALNAITGETGAGKTILSNAIGLLLGARGDAAAIGPAAAEAYVEAELDLPDDDDLGALAELRPEGEDSLVLARRIFADGRTRAYAWGRAAAREDVAAAAERLIAMSGQFEQRRLARPVYQLDVLDAYSAEEQARRRARPGSRSCACSRRTARGSSRGRRTSCASSASASGTSTTWCARRRSRR